MKINKNNVEQFKELIKSCESPVYLTDWRQDENGNPYFKINLKSSLSLLVGISKLLSDKGDWYEIFTSNREDEAKIMEFIYNG